MDQIFSNIIFAFISLLFILLWAVFFFFYSPRKTTPKKVILISFILGVVSACIAFLIEAYFLPFLRFDLFFNVFSFQPQNFIDLYFSFILFLFFIAAIEELIKLVIIRKYIKINEVNQVIDGLKIGLWLGFGFAFVENIFYFINFHSQIKNSLLLIGVILLRGIFSTLAHALYGAVMGYYLSLAKFNKLYQYYFLQKGFLISFIIHGFFNFFLLTNLGFFSVLILIFILLFALYLYNKKQNLENYMQLKGKILVSPPLMSDRPELETLLSKQNAPAEYFRQLLKIFPPNKSKK